MKKFLILIIILILDSVNLFSIPNINLVTDNSPVNKYEKLEITFDLGNNYSNPYDPSQIDVTVNFTSPTGITFSVKGFIYQGYERNGDINNQVLTPQGGLIWKARFTPNETGIWSYIIYAVDTTGSDTFPARQFTVNSSSKKGFIRVSNNDKRYFVYDDGSFYFAIGENVCWSGSGRTYNYDAWLSNLAANGGNFIRIWNAPWHTEIEWAWSYPSNVLGNYASRQKEAWELDYILQKCEDLGIKVMLCLINHGKFDVDTNPNWDYNPYNILNGGFMDRAIDIWTNSTARSYLERNWRYYISRYAHYTSLLCWELWNEMEWTGNTGSSNPDEKYSGHISDSVNWHTWAKNFIKSMDPYKHIITTSYANTRAWGQDVWNTGMEIVQEHNYGGQDMAAVAYNIIQDLSTLHSDKPLLIGEIGIGAAGGEETYDPTGIYLHTSSWACLMAKAAGGAMSWWWDNYIHPYNLYYRYKGIANFLKDEILDNKNYISERPIISTSIRSDYYISPGFTTWMVPAPENNFTVYNAGYMIPSESKLGSRLYGPWKAEARNDPTFNVNFPVNGKFKVTCISEGSPGANGIRIDLDGVPQLNQFPVTMGTTYEINVPSGPHTIFVTNSGNDWVEVSFTLTDYTYMLRCYALKGNNRVLGWIQSRNWTYWNVYNGMPLTYVNDGILHLTGLNQDGIWTYEWYETLNGTLTSSGTVNAESGNADINVPSINKDIAFKIFYTGGFPTNTPTPQGTNTFTKTLTQTQINTATFTETNIVTSTYTQTFVPSTTFTSSATFTPSATFTDSPTGTFYTDTPTTTFTLTETLTPTFSNTETYTPTNTLSISYTFTHTNTFTPSQTFTLNYTYTFTATATNTFVNTPSFTATYDYSKKIFKIIISELFPNPVFSNELNVKFKTSKNIEKIEIRIYSSSFRLIRKYIDENIWYGFKENNIKILDINLANGIYYYIIFFTSDSKEKIKSKIKELIILR